MSYPYVICNVFTQTTFGGNPLAVVLDAESLSTEQMQDIARQFNYSETTFVMPPAGAGDFHVRIFTPSSEVPFAGHPNIGTSFVLAQKGLLAERTDVAFEERAGLVPISLAPSDAGLYTELTAPEALSLGETFSVEDMAALLSLDVLDVRSDRHLPTVASVGLPFIIIELASVEALQNARVNTQLLDRLLRDHPSPFMHLYVRSGDEFDIRTRMFAPTDGVPEDPATGSANCALAALLAQVSPEDSLQQTLRIAQGVEMGRPSELVTRVGKEQGQVTDVKIGGYSVLFAEGVLTGL